MLAAEAREGRVSRARQLVIEIADFAGGRYVQAAQNIEQCRFPAPRRSQHHHEFSGVEIQIDAAKGVHLHLAHPIYFRDAVDVKDRVLAGQIGAAG